MTYEQALAFWHSRINYELRAPKPGDLKLDRMRALLRLLGDPHERLSIVHVAGSKGKGSTAAMLANVLRRAGYRTGLFTSPHLVRVEERIQVDGRPITPQELAARMAEVRPVVEALDAAAADPGGRPTFFEVVTALGFLHFVYRRAEAAVFEVGLGGRFDATNVCRPLVALITSISLDHTQQLGTTLASIAFEKAGIVKPGVPTVSGATGPEARPVIERICRERRSPLRQLGVEFEYRYTPGQITADAERHPQVRVVTHASRWRSISTPGRCAWPPMELGLLGEHQAANAAVAVAGIEELREAGLHIPDEAVAAGLAGVSWPARLEVVRHRPLVVLDCAHNLASVQALVDTLKTSFPPARRLLLFAASNDKDLSGMLRILAPHFAHIFLTRYTHSPRSATPEQLVEILGTMTAPPYTVCANPAEAWQAALGQAAAGDMICITGSVFLAGEVRPLLGTG